MLQSFDERNRDIVINVNGIMSMRDLVEAVRRELGDRGSGLSLEPRTS